MGDWLALLSHRMRRTGRLQRKDTVEVVRSSEKKGSMQAQTDTSCVFLKTELNVVQLKSIHMAVAQRQCSGDLSFLLVLSPCLA